MNRKNLIRAMTAFVLIALVVGVLVWPTPKEAAANETYTMHLYWMNNGVPTPMSNCLLQFRFMVNGQYPAWSDDPANDISSAGNGDYIVIRANAAEDWQVRISPNDGNDLIGVSPWVGSLATPGSQTSVSWRLLFPM